MTEKQKNGVRRRNQRWRKKNIHKIKTYSQLSDEVKENSKKSGKIWRNNNPKNSKIRNKIAIKNLSDYYIENLLSKKGFSKESITSELIETQRLIIQIKRLSKEKKCKTSKNLEVV